MQDKDKTTANSYSAMTIRNIGVMAHVDAGKTTLTEQMLFQSGAIALPGRVDKGNTVTDAMLIERQRGITVRAATTSFFWKGCKINLLDTPGHMDFIAEVERVFGVLDGAVLVISAHEAVQAQTAVIFNMLRRLQVPTIFFINKLDRQGVDLEHTYRQIREMLTEDTILMQRAQIESEGSFELHEQSLTNDFLSQTLLERNIGLLERYLDSQLLGTEDYLQALREEVGAARLYPILHGAALRGAGVTQLMDAIIDLLPEASGDTAAESAALVYKIDRDESRVKRTYLKVLSGNLTVRQKLSLVESTDANEAEPVRIKSLWQLRSGALIQTERVACGDIAVLENDKVLKIGDHLGSQVTRQPQTWTGRAFLQIAVEPEQEEDRARLITALQELTEEDPMLGLEISEYKEISVKVLGQTQQEIIEALLSQRYKLRAVFGAPRVILREHPLNQAEAVVHWGFPNPYRAEIGLRIEPLPQGSGLIYQSEVTYGYITTSFQNAVREGVESGCKQGPLGWEVTDLKVVFTQAIYDSVSSSPADFRDLTPFVLDRALRKAQVGLLEPFGAFKAEVPAPHSGRLLYDIGQLRGRVEAMVNRGPAFIAEGVVPLETARDYIQEVFSYTGGRGIFYLEPRGFWPYQGEPRLGNTKRSLAWEKLRGRLIKQEQEG